MIVVWNRISIRNCRSCHQRKPDELRKNFRHYAANEVGKVSCITKNRATKKLEARGWQKALMSQMRTTNGGEKCNERFDELL